MFYVLDIPKTEKALKRMLMRQGKNCLKSQSASVLGKQINVSECHCSSFFNVKRQLSVIFQKKEERQSKTDTKNEIYIKFWVEQSTIRCRLELILKNKKNDRGHKIPTFHCFYDSLKGTPGCSGMQKAFLNALTVNRTQGLKIFSLALSQLSYQSSYL